MPTPLTQLAENIIKHEKGKGIDLSKVNPNADNDPKSISALDVLSSKQAIEALGVDQTTINSIMSDGVTEEDVNDILSEQNETVKEASKEETEKVPFPSKEVKGKEAKGKEEAWKLWEEITMEPIARNIFEEWLDEALADGEITEVDVEKLLKSSRFSRFFGGKITKAAFDAIFGNFDSKYNEKDYIKSKDELVVKLKVLKYFMAATGTSFAELCEKDKFIRINRVELAKVVAGISKKGFNKRFYNFAKGIDEKETPGITKDQWMAIALLLNENIGFTAYLRREKMKLDGIDLTNEQVMREFKGIFKAFVEERKIPTKKELKHLKKLSKK